MFEPQLSQSRAEGAGSSVSSWLHQSVAFQGLHNSGSVHASHLAQKTRTFQQSDIFARIDAVLARRASWARESQALPHADDRRRDAYQFGDVPDFQIIVV